MPTITTIGAKAWFIARRLETDESISTFAGGYKNFC
jgi:hypothetical protein